MSSALFMLALALSAPSPKCDFDKMPKWAYNRMLWELGWCLKNKECSKKKLFKYSPQVQQELEKVCVPETEL